MTLKLGRKPNDPGRPRLKLSPHLAAVAPPPSCDFYTGVPVWGMLLNDQLGDCTCAGDGHVVCQQTALGLGTEANVTNQDTLEAYEVVGGYVPGDPSTDQGATVQNALEYLRNPGMAGFKLGQFGEVDVTNITEVKAAVSEFGCLSIGVNLPDSAMQQFQNGEPWSYVAGSPIDGGHCVIVVGYDEHWIYLVTWGTVWKMTYEWWANYVEEAWACISKDWQSKSGLSLDAFGEEFAELTGEPNPFVSPTPAPPVTPPDPIPPLNIWDRIVGFLAAIFMACD